MFQYIMISSFPVAMIVAAGFDIWRMVIPNVLVGLLVLNFVPAAFASEIGVSLLLAHAACAFVALIVCVTFFVAGWMGGGDAKLIAATVLWLGPGPALWSYILLATFLGGLVTIFVLLLRSCLWPTTGLASFDRILTKDAGIPYGIALGAAGLLTYASPNFPL